MFKKLAVLILFLACATSAFAADNSYWSAIALEQTMGANGVPDIPRAYVATCYSDPSTGGTATTLFIPHSGTIVSIELVAGSPGFATTTLTVTDLTGQTIIPTSSSLSATGYTLSPSSGTWYPISGGVTLTLAGNTIANAPITVKVGMY